MLIGIDGNEANVEKRVGIGEYGFELLQQFENFQFPISNFQFRIYLKFPPIKDLPKERDGWNYRIVKPSKLWTQIGLPVDLFFHHPRPDVFFSPTHYAPRFSLVPIVISIMDLSYLHFPKMFKKSDLYQLKNWTKYSVKKAKAVFTISNASKGDIIKMYKIPDNKVVVTYPGIKMKIRNPKSEIRSNVKTQPFDFAQGKNSKLKTRYGIEGEYILFVGTLQPRKNLIRLIEAFSKVIKNSKRKDLSLLIVGKKGWLFEEILNAPERFEISNKVKFLEFVPDGDLEVLYQNALCFVLPSLYEGFGLPVLEAMKNGCPVITSNVSSLPEAGGDAALYIDPQNIEDIKNKIKLLINDPKLRQELIKKGYNQVKKFSWEKTARETLKVLEEVTK